MNNINEKIKKEEKINQLLENIKEMLLKYDYCECIITRKDTRILAQYAQTERESYEI